MATDEAPYDVIIKGGRVVDPAAGHDEIADIAVRDGKIAAVAAALSGAADTHEIDASGLLVTPGLIDTHAHVYQHVTGRFGLNADHCGVRSGVTTLVDQGGPSLMTIPGFRHYVVEPAASRVLCFISAYLVGGLEGHYYPELYGPTGVDVAGTIKAAEENRDLVKGVKAHAEIGGASRWGVEVVKLAKEIASGASVPLYVHLGQLWPTKDDAPMDADRVIAEMVPLLGEGDILAHPFTRHPGGFVSEETGDVHPIVWRALERGVRVDVGHGSHFSFDMAKRVLDAGIKPFTLGADMHGYNVRAPGMATDADTESNPFFGVAPFSMCHAMSELLCLGMSLADVVATATCNPATMLGLTNEIGGLQPGMDADISVLDLRQGSWSLQDNTGAKMTASEVLVPRFVLRRGVQHVADSPLVPEPRVAA